MDCNESNSCGVSWSAVIAGVFVTAALAVILLALGSGLGLSSISPWSNIGASAQTMSIATIVWLIAMQIISSAVGGYLAGRLRTKWSTIHEHEVYFRDTAHGFLVWAVALVITSSFLGATATYMVGGAAQVVTSSKSERDRLEPSIYLIDNLFRSDNFARDKGDRSLREEVATIFANSFLLKEIPRGDRIYLVKLITAKTGLQEAEADKRISEIYAEIKESADVSRKAAAHGLLWLFITFLIGAFCASYAATIGGKQRDEVKARV